MTTDYALLSLLHPQIKAQVNQDIESRIANSDLLLPLAEATRYAAIGAGKQVRPLLVAASYLSLINNTVTSASGEITVPSATLDLYLEQIKHHLPLRQAMVAIELIHAYSLIHDDLPCMDDDDLRRGKATTHIAYGEATALLAGDVLQTLAFEALSASDWLSVTSSQSTTATQCSTTQTSLALSLVGRLAPCARRMVVGQQQDLLAEHMAVDEATLSFIHANKTGALFEAAVQMGALCATATPTQYDHLSKFARQLGLAFQVQDDILDVTTDTETLGKPAGSDDKLAKSTYVQLLGVEPATLYAQQLFTEATEQLRTCLTPNSLLETVAQWLWQRSK